MDFYDIVVTKYRKGTYDYRIRPKFSYSSHKDLVCKGGGFYAFWDKEKDIWDTNIGHLIAKIDNDVIVKMNELNADESSIQALLMDDSTSGIMNDFIVYTRQVEQSDISFNTKVLFRSDDYKREYYSTTRLQYDPEEGSTEAFDTLIDSLYSSEEKEKILWFMGALLTGSMPKIQKFMFLHGGKGTGKGTVIKIFEDLFQNYYSHIDLRNLTSDGAFATSEVKELPLLIDDDCDMYSIKNDTPLLKLTSHEPITVNRKYEKTYSIIFNGLLIAASNQSYRVRNVDSGIMRRAVTVYPSNNTLPYDIYMDLMSKIKFEIPHIAHTAMKVFKKLGSGYFNSYEDLNMAAETDYFLDFMREKYDVIKENMDSHEGYLLGKDYAAYLYDYLTDNGWDSSGYKKRVRTEGKRFFKHVYPRKKVNGIDCRNVFADLMVEKIFGAPKEVKPKINTMSWIVLKEQESLLDTELANMSAQYANSKGTPRYSWDLCSTRMSDLNSKQLHYVRVPENHIVIDFDISNENDEKDFNLSLEAASKFPQTYVEVSQSGNGLHLHYIYDGDVNRLSSVYEHEIEIKVYRGKGSLRRKLTACNDIPIAHISTGLPLREDGDKVFAGINDIFLNEKKMKTIIDRAMHKNYHDDTSSNVNYICAILKSAEERGVKYDLRKMKQDALTFASCSTHQSDRCIKAIMDANWCTIDEVAANDISKGAIFVPDEDLYTYDIEVFPNLMLVCYKQLNKEPKIYFNPSPQEVRDICENALMGFNNTSYDNTIMYERMMGRTIPEIYEISKDLIDKRRYSSQAEKEISYLDLYDLASEKQSLKRWEVDLKRLGYDVQYDEFELDFDEPLPEDKWDRCAEYCKHDVEATEKLFFHLYPDYVARKIAATLSGLSVNSATNDHSAQFIFGDDFNPQRQFNYVDLSKEFEGYQFNPRGIDRSLYSVDKHLIVTGKSIFMGEDPSEGGYVYVEPGVYSNVKTYDIASMHPSSIIAMNLFGDKYTKRFEELVKARIYIKHKDYDSAKKMFDGKLEPFLQDEENAKGLSAALKILINSVYGLTAKKKPSKKNRFRDPRNIDNIVAKRGSLFMILLKHKIQEMGYQVIHIKTDSIKIANPDEKVEQFIFEFGKQYGYTFEVEDVWKRIAIVNKGVFIGQVESGEWKAVGKQFAVPYVYKKLFTKEDISREDYAEIKQVRSTLYLGDYPVMEDGETIKEYKERCKKFDIPANFQFLGRLAVLYASNTGFDIFKFDKTKGTSGFVQGTKGYKWRLMSDFVSNKDINHLYYDNLVIDAIEAINSVGPSSLLIDEPLETLYSNHITFY